MALSIGGNGGNAVPDQLVVKSSGKKLPKPSGNMKPPKIKGYGG